MSKRPASPSPIKEPCEEKKLKLDLTCLKTVQEDSLQEEVTDDDTLVTVLSEIKDQGSQYAYTLMAESFTPLADHSAAETTGEGQHKGAKRASKASEGFRPWKPVVADNPIPACELHWGIIPRLGGYRPPVYQPPARLSNGAIEPPLWEDRKGGVRVKRGDRIINGYDQAYHLWLPLMNLRPKPQDQQPKREPITYQCQHGIPIDWSDSKALTVANKGIQNAIRDNSNKEGPWSEEERETLAAIFLDQPMISLLDAAQLFNDRAHPLKDNVDRKGFYPTGRFTESIQHEYRIYKTTYDEGQAPRLVATDGNPASRKEIPLDDLIAKWKHEQSDVVETKEAKKTAKDAKQKQRARAARTATTGQKSNVIGNMSETAGVTNQKRKGNRWEDKTPEEQAAIIARADTTGREIEDSVIAEMVVKSAGGIAKTPPEVKSLQQTDPIASMTGPRPFSGEDAKLCAAAGGIVLREAYTSPPMIVSACASVALPLYRNEHPAAYMIKQTPSPQTLGSNTKSLSCSKLPVATQPAIVEAHTGAVAEFTAAELHYYRDRETLHVEDVVIAEENAGDLRKAVEPVFVKSVSDNKAARDVSVDENYYEDDIM